MKVKIDRDRDGWFYAEGPDSARSLYLTTYPEIKARAIADGHEVDNAGWLHRLLLWQWNHHALDGYPTWEMEGEAPAFVKLAHTRGAGHVESHALASAWDDIAAVDFYQRDWTEHSLPTVCNGDMYWSG